jgi:hypothetical protein
VKKVRNTGKLGLFSINIATLADTLLFYSDIHLKNNPNYSQFIKGDEIAVMKVIIEKARLCDINDNVSYWNAKDGSIASQEKK